MSTETKLQCTAFAGDRCLASGSIETVIPAVKAYIDAEGTASPLIFDDETGRQVEVDFRGSLEEILARQQVSTAPVRPGRPKLGVESREVTLLPRHWEWLQTQPGGASATLRKLVEAARRSGAEQVRIAQEAAHRFMWAMTGNMNGFEEASRAFFAKDYAHMDSIIAQWPPDIRDHVRHLTERLRQIERSVQKEP
jgi:uncharacterized protein